MLLLTSHYQNPAYMSAIELLGKLRYRRPRPMGQDQHSHAIPATKSPMQAYSTKKGVNFALFTHLHQNAPFNTYVSFLRLGPPNGIICTCS